MFNNIPEELKGLPKWVCWRNVDKNGKKTKIPSGSVSNPSTWMSFEEAFTKYKNEKFDGVGFVFTEDDPYCFLDLDNCYNTKMAGWAEEILKKLNSYSEISHSGRGIHVIVKAKIPLGCGNRKENFEIYDRRRYCALTGKIIDGYPTTIESRQKEIEELCVKIFTSQADSKIPAKISQQDYEIIDKIKTSKQSDKFFKLYNGDTSDYKSESEADLALVSIIAFYTKDREQILRILQRSALWDEKWERGDYQARTINKALVGIGDTEKMNWIIEKNICFLKYFENHRFIPKFLADDITSQYQFIFAGGLLYIYLDGVWRPIGDDFIKNLCREKLGNEARIHRINEVLAHIQDTSWVQILEMNKHKNLINLRNGMLDWQTGKLFEHDPKYYSSIRIPVVYDPSADSSKIAEWLETTLKDAELIQLVFELLGYSLIPDTSMCKAFMLVGSGKNGKSTFISVMEQLLGTDNVSKVPLQELAEHRFKRAELFGKLVNLFADLDNKSLENTTYFKTIVSGDSIDAERKNRDPFFFRPFARLVFSANEIPRTRDKSYAYYRRWCIIPFEQKFDGKNENKNLLAELNTRENMSALLNNAIAGLRSMMKRGDFVEPQKVQQALQDYEKQNDPVKAFLSNSCVFDPQEMIERGALYNEFCKFCVEEGYKETSRNYFYQRIKSIREINEVRFPQGRFFKGIKIKNHSGGNYSAGAGNLHSKFLGFLS